VLLMAGDHDFQTVVASHAVGVQPRGLAAEGGHLDERLTFIACTEHFPHGPGRRIAGKHVARMMRENRFTDWEAIFYAMEGGRFAGYCTFLKEDYYPENRYSPWISSMFVDEAFRGRRISGQMPRMVPMVAEGPETRPLRRNIVRSVEKN